MKIRDLRPKNSVYEQGLLDWINAIPKEKRGALVQVGVWTGGGTRLFAKYFTRVIDIDPYEGPCENGYTYDDVYAQYIANCGKLKNVTHYRKRSLDAIKDFAKKSIHAAYIDGMHDYTSVKNDSEAWYPIVYDGGFIGGHDYCDTFPGVKRAVNELVELNNGTLQLFKDGSWLMPKV